MGRDGESVTNRKGKVAQSKGERGKGEGRTTLVLSTGSESPLKKARRGNQKLEVPIRSKWAKRKTDTGAEGNWGKKRFGLHASGEVIRGVKAFSCPVYTS